MIQRELGGAANATVRSPHGAREVSSPLRLRPLRSPRWRRAAALAVAVAGVALSGRAEPATPGQPAAELVDSAPAPGEKGLAARLLAPCCWDQTLDVHESEVTRDLRREIRARLRRGESADAIEQDLVGRYGERIRAAPSSGVLGKVALGLMLGIAVSFLGVLVLLRSWRRSAAQPASSSVAVAAAARDAYDERLDDELREREA
ncbi:cytochrome c-type biogenesis protein [Sorangium cellulosum]|uniref:cytochrome c-type biogenesis protein n=1 Tax=Sorangium TaxID=39643 RepID=UPI000A87F590|nr:cytochrome c-type biogenesis protein CcmH [Sorangium cellulosum]